MSLGQLGLYVSVRCGKFSESFNFNFQFSADNLMPKVNNRNTRIIGGICSKLMIMTLEKCQWHCSGVFIVSLEDISPIVLVFLLLNLSR